MFLPLRAVLPGAYAIGLLWLNAYLVRHVFSLTYSGATHSMHGYWMALGRVMGDSRLVALLGRRVTKVEHILGWMEKYTKEGVTGLRGP